MIIMLHNKMHSGERGDLVVQFRVQEGELGWLSETFFNLP